MARKGTMRKDIGGSFKRYLITGVLVWLPIAVTVWVITYIVSKADQLISLMPENWQPQNLFGYNIPGLGVVLTLIILIVTGIFAANVLGKKVINAWDKLLSRIPVVKSIYSSVKKVSESLLSDSRQSFKIPVLVAFPQPDIWTIGFVSGNVPETINTALDGVYVSVYVPTTPNPTSGYYILVKESDIRYVDMSVDNALKYVISLGMVLPENGNKDQKKEL